MIVAIDGPGGAGKSTVAKLLAVRLGMTYIDTGAMYRAVAYYIINGGMDANDADAVRGALPDINIDIGVNADGGSLSGADGGDVDGGSSSGVGGSGSHDIGKNGSPGAAQTVWLNGRDITALIRTPTMSIGASDVSRIPEVRYRMVELQRGIAQGRDCVMDGRDIGTFVFPNAEFKYYLTASAGERARRRYLELRSKGGADPYGKCLSDLRYRDEMDSGRSLAPLSVASDAIIVGTDYMTAVEAADFIYSNIISRGRGAGR